jgi:alpha-tubulin suppressor-like RCC1 family protein/uncharacterized protein YjdB
MGGSPVPALRRARVWLALAGCGLGGLALSGCGGGGGLAPSDPPTPKPSVDSVGINVTSGTLLVGDSIPLTARVAAQNGASTGVTWQSSDATKARVTSTPSGGALVFGIAPGAVTITATSTFDASKHGDAPLTVRIPPAITGLTVSPLSVSVPAKQTATIKWTYTPANAGVQATVGLTSADTGVAKVNNAGLLTGVAPGSTTVTVTAIGSGQGATTDTLIAAVSVTVTPALLPAITGLTVTPSPVSLVAGQTATLQPSVTPANGSVQVSYGYQSTNPAAASVSATGIITGAAAGSANVIVTAIGSGAGLLTDTLRTTVPVTVSPAPGYSLALGPAALSLTAGISLYTDVSLSNLAGGFTGPVALTVTGAPAGVSVSAAPANAQVSRGSSVRLTVAVASTVAAGAYTLAVSGSAAGLADRTATLTLNVAAAPPPLGIVSTVVAGSDYTCYLSSAGQTLCWGTNSNGQLGDGTLTERHAPAPIAGGPNFVTLTGGDGHVCGLTSAGQAFCWGRNGHGQLGDGTVTDRTNPTPVVTGQAFTDIVAGFNHTCGLTSAGQTLCWGLNNLGQLGDGTVGERSTPVAIPNAPPFRIVRAGQFHTCGVTGAGQMLCWGWNSNGQLGDGTTTNRSTPTPVAMPAGQAFQSPAAGVIPLALGYLHSCGLNSTAVAFCWGGNNAGELGDGTRTDRTTPGPVQFSRTFSALYANSDRTCGLSSTSLPACWGNNQYGQLGDGTLVARFGPTSIIGGRSFSVLAMGATHTCGLTVAGQLFCWGRNNSGQLGDGSTNGETIPVAVVLPLPGVRLP